MSVDSDLKADLILEDLSKQLIDASIEHCFTGNTHAFTIHLDGTVWRVDFPERVLLEHPIRDLEKFVPTIIERMLAGNESHHIQIGDSLAGALAAV